MFDIVIQELVSEDEEEEELDIVPHANPSHTELRNIQELVSEDEAEEELDIVPHADPSHAELRSIVKKKLLQQ